MTEALLSNKRHIFSALSAIFFLIFAYWFFFVSGKETTDNAYLKSNFTALSPRVSGYIVDISVQDNQVIEAGHVIAHIDDRDYKARIAQAESLLESSKAHLLTLESQKNLQMARIRQAESGISSANAVLEKSTKDFTRSRSLVKDGAISQQFLDASTAEQKNALASLEKSQAELDAAKIQLTMTENQRVETQSQVKNAQATLELAKIDLENTVLKAPVSGTIGNKSMQVGQLVRPGVVLGYLIPQNDIWIDANFKETQVEKIKPGQPVSITVDSYPSHSFKGTIDSISPASGSEFSLLPPENATGNFTKIVRRIPIKIVFHQETDFSLLKPGMSTIVKVHTR